ncbi:MAG: F0F1 ATP synthase subunit B [Anaerolineales bacterium]|nr:F0F1 ATP synthase subunit B [Anaerolineales bacterium]
MEKLGINLGTFLFYLLNFTALMIVLGAWIYKPMVKALEDRQKKIAQGLHDAEVAAEARSKAEAEAQHIRGAAQQEASQKLREATESAAKAAEAVRAEAEKDIAALRDAGRAEIAAERNRMLSDLRPRVAALAIAAAQKLIGEALDEKRQHALIDEFFSGVRSGKVILLEESGALPSAEKAEVTSALPLSEAEQESIRREVAAKAGAGIGVAFQVDPDLLGGLKVRIGDRVIDGSVAGRIESLRKSMQ